MRVKDDGISRREVTEISQARLCTRPAASVSCMADALGRTQDPPLNHQTPIKTTILCLQIKYQHLPSIALRFHCSPSDHPLSVCCDSTFASFVWLLD